MAKTVTPDSILVYIGHNPDNALGENIIKLPFLRAIRQAFPDARVSWMYGRGPSFFENSLKPLAAGLIDEVLNHTSLGASAAELFRRAPPLPGRRFDLVIDTQHALHRTLIVRRVAHDRFVSPTWNFRFSDLKPPAGLPRPTLLVDRLLALVAAAAGRVVRPSHVAPLPEPWYAAADRILRPGPVYVGLAPGAGRRETGKCWPLERFIAVAREQGRKGRVPVFFPGPNEAEWLPLLRQRVPDAIFPEWGQAAPPGDMAGPPLVVALARHLAVAVSNCSGTGHLLAAGGAPMVSLFGPTNPGKFAPYTPSLSVLTAQQFGGTTMDSIPADAVLRAVDAHVAVGPAGGPV